MLCCQSVHIRVLAGLAVATLFGACDPLDDDFTDDVSLRFITSTVFLTPAGGTCEECAVGAVMTSPLGHPEKTLELSLDMGAAYTGQRIAMADDVPLATLLVAATVAGTEVQWELVTASGEVVCRAQPVDGTCQVGALQPVPDTNLATLVVKYTSDLHEVPALLRLTQVPGVPEAGEHGPTVRIHAGPLEPAAATTKPHAWFVASANPDPSQSAVVHVTHPARYGGIRSCSGVLVSAQHVLTAKQCFTNATVLVPEIAVRLGTSAELGASHGATALAIHPSLDLAVLTLDTAVELPGLQIPSIAAAVADNCETIAAGFGLSAVKFADRSYTWGHLKQVELALDFASPQGSLWMHKSPGQTVDLCRGDAGGPVLQRCGASLRLVGVTTGRIRGAEGVAMRIERLGQTFALSRGEVCERESVLAYVATELEGVGQAWIADIVEPPSQQKFQAKN